MKKIAILGSTGSVGQQTLQVIAANQDDFCVEALVAYSDESTLLSQKTQFSVPFAGLICDTASNRDLSCGKNCLIDAIENADIVVVATRGIVALKSVLVALEAGKTVALANKEILVTAGKLVLETLHNSKGTLIPVDSEHSALFQCLDSKNHFKRLILTASGGAFWGKSREYLQTVTKEDALNHPRWSMGKKITIDSATLINKGFEVIEAHWLFGADIDDINVVVHPQSIVHSLVEFYDGSIIAQMAVPDMRLPISYALSYPKRLKNIVKPLNLCDIGALEFLSAKNNNLIGVDICIDAFKQHILMPTVLNAVDEVAVDAFLQDKIGFLQIYNYIQFVCDYYKNKLNGINFGVEQIERLDKEVKMFSKNAIEVNKCC